jgi:glycyl-tRNA synthetase beta chain
MTGHQRYFPLEGEGGKLAPRFAYVANRELHPVIRRGNERVLAARLSDALYFFQQDQKRPLNERVDQLEQIVFMQELGTYRARIERVDALALEAADAAGWVPRDASDPGRRDRPTTALSAADQLALHIHLAARLQRADLTTEVVQEFPELQGEMGAIYARLQELHDDVAEAIREAYLPRGEGDALPATKVGMCVALADKVDTIVAAFATGRGPTGSKDPFMVRRNVLGVLRILRERQLDLGYGRLLDRAIAQLPGALRKDGLREEIGAYFRDRQEVMAREAGFHHQLIRAALASGVDPTNVLDLWTRLAALQALARHPRFPRLCELVERSRNITQKNGPEVDPEDVEARSLTHPAEQALHQAIQGCKKQVQGAIAGRRYEEAGKLYVEALAEVTHTFFEPSPRGVFVMDDDPRLRRNRLALLKQVHGLLAEGFADLSLVDVKALGS